MSEAGRALIQTADGGWLSLVRPVEVIIAGRAEEVPAVLECVETQVAARGWHAVGVVAFEAGGAWGLPVGPSDPDIPVAWFGLYPSDRVTLASAPSAAGGYQVSGLIPSADRQVFDRAFARVHQHLADGDTYQVNYTFRMEGRFTGDAERLFAHLSDAQQGRCSAFVDLGRHVVCSASPELFFTREDGVLSTRPMKGTAPRGRTSEEDNLQRRALAASPKQRAENVMIVDMMRNDLGRIAEIGTVAVPRLFQVERYPNVWQMTSTVTARSTARLVDVFGALHPSASVTGAPKVSTMAILRQLEPHPRGIYTGAIGHIAPNGSARFNVAIRTALVDRAAETVRFGIGSGLVWDSDPADEYAECLLKGSILTCPMRDFDLLETLRWTPQEGYWLLDRHLDRLADSSSYFGRQVDVHQVRQALASAVQGAAGPLRVRLLVDRRGDLRVELRPLVMANDSVVLRLARTPIDSSNVLLFHKTTARQVYEEARLPACDDTLLWNEKGLVTETTIANVLVELDGRVVTPPVECGLLAGTCRAELLARGEVVESKVAVDEVRGARRLWVTNAVHGRRPAILVPD